MKITRLTCILLLGCLSVAACSSTSERETTYEKPASADGKGKQPQLSEQDLRQEADTLYRHARKSLDSGEYSSAITDYDKLIARYPFTDYGTQAELEKIFAQYKTYQYDEALSSADRFLRDHPRHPKADYVQYLKGLIDFDRNAGILDSLQIDSSKHDVSSERLAYNDFALLVLKYPNSRYISDARLRMVWLRNRVAQHELSIVTFYIKRGAYVAAAKRAETIIAEYPGAPATGEALKLLQRCYREIGLSHEADDAAKLIAANPGALKPVESKPVRSEAVAAAPAIAAGSEVAPVPPQAQPAVKQSHGFFSWFAGLFSFLDTTRPENTYEIVIPTHGSDQAAAPAPAAPPAETSGAASPGGAVAAPAAGNNGDKPKSRGLHMTIGPEPGDEWHPIDAPASGVGTPAPAVIPSQPSPAAPDGTSDGAHKSGLILHFSDSLSTAPPPSNAAAEKKPSAPPAAGTAQDPAQPASPAAEPAQNPQPAQ